MEPFKKDVWLSIHSVQRYEEWEQEDAVDLMTQARLYCRGGKYYISYEESALTGLEGTRTTVKLDGGTVSMIRTGACPSQMLFLENQRHVGLYHTGVGQPLTISTHTSRIENTIGPEGGTLEIDYTIEIDSACAGENHFTMQVSLEPPEQAE